MNESRLDRLYSSLPHVECKGLCQECCGPIGMNMAEAERIERFTGEPLKMVGSDLVCPYLKEGKCSVYALRPLVCRLWGAVPEMPCPHGCKVTGSIPKRKIAKAFRNAENCIHTVTIETLEAWDPKTGSEAKA